MRKISVLLALIFILIMAPAALADNSTTAERQLDVGSFDTWLYSDGMTWQAVPGYGVVKPGDSPTYTYIVTYSGASPDRITGVNSVVAFDGIDKTYNSTTRSTGKPFNDYVKESYYKYSVKTMSVNSYQYLGSGQVKITVTPLLDTYYLYPGHADYSGEYQHQFFQGKLTQGRRFYTPAVIEWQIKDGSPDFWPSVPTLNYTGTPGSTITIPAMVFNSGTDGTTDFAAAWNGAGWTNPTYKIGNLTIAKGGNADTPFTVTVPAITTKLWLRANIDGVTPATEVNQANNVISVKVGPNTADVGVSISAKPTRPERDCSSIATVYVTNHGPASADVHLVIGENNGSNQVINYYDQDEYRFTLASGASKTLTYESDGNDAGYKTYFATKADVTNTLDPNLANNFARTPLITWQAYTPPPVVPSSGSESSLIHTE